jgi:hypothetical protein
MATTQAFCLRRNNHPIDMIEDFEKMFKNEDLVDVSLSCEDGTIRAHKVILSACSSYFRQILSKFTSPYQYPVLIIKDMCFADLKAIIEFIYRGEVTVPQEQLSSVLKSAEALKVKGLADVNNQKCGIASKLASAVETDESTGGGVHSNGRKRKRKRRKGTDNRDKSQSANGPNLNSSGQSERDRAGAVSDEELNKQLLCSSEASEYSDEEDELNVSAHHSHTSQHPTLHSHLHAPTHHQTNSAISVISSEGDIEPSRLLEQTMITGDVILSCPHPFANCSNADCSSFLTQQAQNIGGLQSMNPVGSQGKNQV